MASSLAGALGPVVGFTLFQRFDYAGVFLGAAGLLATSFLLGLPVPERRTVRPEEGWERGWLEAIVVKETLPTVIAVAFLSFGHGGILTFLQSMRCG
jgi:hypothetical protein